MSYLGALDISTEIGAAPYQIQGDPVVALIAQLNRFANKTFTAGPSCRDYRILGPALPLVPTLDNKAASTAVLALTTRYSCVPIDVWSKTKSAWANAGLLNPESFVKANLKEATVTIAQFADSLGFPAASVGITTRDPMMTPKFPTMIVAGIGLMAVAAFFVSRRKR